MAFTKEEAERIRKALLWDQPPRISQEILALVARETEKLVVRKKEEEWRDVVADMIREGKDEDAWMLFITKSKHALNNIAARMRALEKVYDTGLDLLNWADRGTGRLIKEYEEWKNFKNAWADAWRTISQQDNG